MALKQRQQLRQTQQLSPIQVHLLRLVGLNTLELEDEVRRLADDNPALELETPYPDYDEDNPKYDPEEDGNISQQEMVTGDYASADDIPDFQLHGSAPKSIQDVIENTFAREESLSDFVNEQVKMLGLNDRQLLIADYLVGSLDENGYLERDITAIVDDLFFKEGKQVSTLQVEDVLYAIQDLEPAGVGARDLQECLLLQLQREPNDAIASEAAFMVENYFKEFSKKHFDTICHDMNISRERMAQLIDKIKTLDPKPGSKWGAELETELNKITPDFLIDIEDDNITVSLNNGNVPVLKLNKDYDRMVGNQESDSASNKKFDEATMVYLQQKVTSARNLIHAISQRNMTLLRIMETIVHHQRDFFLTGDRVQLKPLLMKEVASEVGCDVSTVSRVSNNKYVQTYDGIYPLKLFFSESLSHQSGTDASSTAVKTILKELIDNENKLKPLTDNDLGEHLKSKGYNIARRTIAKYREQLNYPVARLRKMI